MAEDAAAQSAQIPAGFDANLLGLDQGSGDVEVESGMMVQFVSFNVGDGEYGIDIMAVREIQGWVNITELPNTPEYVRGVLNLRGTIVPIFDLRCRFGDGMTEASALHVVIIVAVGERTMGLLVDAVSDILTINSEEILPVPDLEERGDQKFIAGLITVKERMVALLEIDKLFDVAALASELAGGAHD